MENSKKFRLAVEFFVGVTLRSLLYEEQNEVSIGDYFGIFAGIRN